MSFNLQIAVIGCGHWGKNLVRNFSELGVLRYVSDINFNQTEKIAKQYSVKVKTLAEILKADVDGIVIAAPAEQHYKLAKDALENGKHVFVEKPLSFKNC